MQLQLLRRIAPAAMLFAVLVTAIDGSARAQGTVTIAAGASAATQVVPGAKFGVPIVVDMSTAGGINLASFAAALSWATGRLTFDSLKAGSFGTLTSSTAGAATGSAAISVFSSTGTTATLTVATAYFTASGTAGGTTVSLQTSAASNDAGANLIPQLVSRSLDVCIAPTGKWGDANGDGSVNIIDAQQIARFSVGLSVANASAVATHGDVTADNAVNIIDAQQIARFSVALTAAARVNTTHAAPPPVASVSISPPAPSVNTGATTQLVGTPADAASNALSGCAPVTWATSDAAKATVNANGLVTGVAAGSVTITATSGAQSAQTTLTVAVPGSAGFVVVSAGDNQFVVAGTPVAVAPAVVVRDASNAVVSGATVTFAVMSGGGAVSGTVVTTNASGVATLGSWTLGPLAGPNMVTATISGAGYSGSPTTFTATGVAAAPSSVAIVSGDNQVQSQGQTFVAPLTVVVRDAANNGVAGASVSFTSSTGNVGAATVFTDAHGIASTSLLGISVGVQHALAAVAGIGSVQFNGITSIAYTGDTRCELTTTGAAYCWGDNTRGQIGDGTTTNRNLPTAVNGGLSFASLAEGSADHACGLTAGGQAYCWGANDFGQLGDGTATNRTAPVAVTGGFTFARLAVSVEGTCGLTGAGVLVCWGGSGWGLFGDGVLGVAQPLPTAVNAGGVTFSRVAIAANHACAIATSGAMYCWGLAGFGALGDGTLTNHVAPTPVGDGRSYAEVTTTFQHTCALTTAGAAYCWGVGSSGQIGSGQTVNPAVPTAVAGGLTYTAISASIGNTCARTTGGDVYCWGSGTGQNGDGTSVQRNTPVLVAASTLFGSIRVRGGNSSGSLATVCARATNGLPYCWGNNSLGQVGDNTTTNRLSPVAVHWVEGTAGAPASMSVNAGNNQIAAPAAAVGTSPSVRVIDFAANPVVGASVTFGVASGGGAVTGANSTTDATGLASVGSWTLGATVGANSLTATVAGLPPVSFSATATGAASTVTIVSGDAQMQVAATNYPANPTVVVRDASNNPVAGVTVTFAVASGNGNVGGAASINVTTAADGMASTTWLASANSAQTITATVTGVAPVTFSARSMTAQPAATRCELTSSGVAFCWGDNTHGQFGDGTTINKSVPTAVSGGLTFTAIADGSADHACALVSGGQAYCWGANAFGQLGDGTTTDRSAPTLVTGGNAFTQLSVSVYATCGVTSAGAIICWGWSGYGLYGDGVLGTIRTSPAPVTAGALTFTKVALSQSHVCAIATSGSMYCWGLGTNGQLGDGTLMSHITPTAVGDGRTYSSVATATGLTCGITASGAAYCWGSSSLGSLGNGTSSGNATSPTAVLGGLAFASISVASNLACALTPAGLAYCWGSNALSQIGDGTNTQRTTPTAVQGGLTFTAVRVRSQTVCGRAIGGQPFCWGNNGTGSVGDGTITLRTVPTPAKWVEGSPGVAASVLINAGNGQSGAVSTAVPVAPSVIVRDFAGNPVSGASVTFAASAGSGSVTGGSVTTNASGIATVGSWILSSTTGPNTLIATVSGLTSAALPFIANATPLGASVSIVSGDNQVQFTLTDYVAPLTVLVRDAANNPLPGASVTFSATAAGGTFGPITPSIVVTTNSTGQASATWNTGGSVGAETATVSINGTAPLTFNGRAVPAPDLGVRCERNAAGASYCWGDNRRNETGATGGPTTAEPTPRATTGALVFTSLAEGSLSNHQCGLVAGGQAYCWGANSFGQLGDGTIIDRASPAAVAGGVTFTRLAVSLTATCGLTSAGVLWCWGSAGYTLYGDGIGGVVHTTPTLVNTAVAFSRVAMSTSNACAVSTSGTMYCWGLGSNGMTGTGTTTRTSPFVVDARTYAGITLGSGHACGLTTAGAAFCWGLIQSGQNGNGGSGGSSAPAAVTGGLVFSSLAAGTQHTCGRTTGALVYCWGLNANGQVGDGTLTQRNAPTLAQTGVILASVSGVANSSCGRTASGQPYCWGLNGSGLVGDGSLTDRSAPVATQWIEGTAGTAVSLVVNAGSPQSGTAGAAVPIAPSVVVRDYTGAAVAGVSVTFTVTGGGGSVTAATAVTNASGIATIGSWTLGASSGANTLTAAAPGLPTVTFTATGT